MEVTAQTGAPRAQEEVIFEVAVHDDLIVRPGHPANTRWLGDEQAVPMGCGSTCAPVALNRLGFSRGSMDPRAVQTAGVLAFAEGLRQVGHTVHTPDLYGGRTFDNLGEGIAFAEEVGFGEIMDLGVRATEGLPDGLVYAGFSLGVVPAQMLAQKRPGACAALFFHSCLPAAEFGGWPDGVPVRIHAMDADPIFVGEGDLEAAQALVAETPQAHLFLYPGNQHLFADPSLPSYDADAAALLIRRVIDFLGVLCRQASSGITAVTTSSTRASVS